MDVDTDDPEVGTAVLAAWNAAEEHPTHPPGPFRWWWGLTLLGLVGAFWGTVFWGWQQWIGGR